MVTQAEINVIKRHIKPGDTVIDVGANRGEWAREVLAHAPGCRLLALEPLVNVDPAIAADLTSLGERVTVLPIGLGDQEGRRQFTYYATHSSFSGFYKRSAPVFDTIPTPDIVDVNVRRLDVLCAEQGIRHVHFLKIDVEGGEWEVIRGAADLLRLARVDFVQFEYGGTYPDAHTKLEWVFTYLSEQGYDLYKVEDTLQGPLTWQASLEDFTYSNFLAVNQRLRGLFRGDKPRMLDTAALLAEYGIQSASILHVGAHLGKEAVQYLERGVGRILLVEANPDLAAELRQRFADRPEIEVAACAAGDRNGTTILRITSNDQSSSILPLHRHLVFYPGITQARQVEVELARLDDIVCRHGWQPAEIDFLNMDIQGAEHLALAGAPEILRHVRAINIEVNFDELYAGCAQIEEIEQILGAAGLRRVAITCPYHPSWGDAFYVR